MCTRCTCAYNCRAFGLNTKKKNPKFGVMSKTVTTKNSKQKEVIWQQYRLCLAVVEHQVLGGKLSYFGTRVTKDLVVEKRYKTFRKSITANGHSCVARNPSRFFITSAICCVHWKKYEPRVCEWFHGMASPVQSLETVNPGQKWSRFGRHGIGNIR